MRAPDLTKLSVLLVDDRPECRMAIREALFDLGVVQVYEADDGSKAAAILDGAYDAVDVILCDWNMPDMAGIEFLKHLRSVGVQIPFIMITGRGDALSVSMAAHAGVNGYICKPVDPVKLAARLMQTADRKRIH